MIVKVLNKSPFPLPEYKTLYSAGMDLKAYIDDAIVLKPLDRVLVPTGLFLSIPKGYEGQIRGRSGLALKHGITLANGIGTIDSDYRGEIKIILINLGKEPFTINNGDRIAQLVLIKHEWIDFDLVGSLDETDRGEGGFGHTGV
jgi:dUTP pyrophosphatase